MDSNSLMEDFTPYPDRVEHNYVNKMTALIVRARLIIDSATKVVDEIKDTTEKHAQYTTNQKRKEDAKWKKYY